MCERLAALGMDLAEAAHREALREMQPPRERSPLRVPGMPDIPMPGPPPYRSTAYSELFEHLSRCVRQAILLEARLESGAYDNPGPHTVPPPRQPGDAPASPRTPGDGTGIYHERLEDDSANVALGSPEDMLASIRADLDPVFAAAPPAAPPRIIFPTCDRPALPTRASDPNPPKRLPPRPG